MQESPNKKILFFARKTKKNIEKEAKVYTETDIKTIELNGARQVDTIAVDTVMLC